MKTFIAASLLLGALTVPALALTYPVSGRYGLSNETKPGPVDCSGKRVIRFDAERRFDSGGGVPDYRVIGLVQESPTAYRVTEEFNTGQIHARLTSTLRLLDPDRIELALQRGGTLKLKRCA
jgi:hypothetical protein